MAIQINTTLNDKTGRVVSTGSYCVIDIHITTRKRADLQILFYINKTAFDNLKSPFEPVEIPITTYSKELTNLEYANVTNISIHNFVKTYLEGILGNNTTELVN